MAKKISSSLSRFTNKVCSGIVKMLGVVLQVVIGILWVVLCVGVLIFSPLWVPIYVLKNPASCACDMYARAKDDDYNFLGRFCIQSGAWTFHLIRRLFMPFISRLPMRYYAEFISCDKKPLNEYSTKTQIAYYKNCSDEKKQELLSKNKLTEEVEQQLWKDLPERANFVAVGSLTNSQIKDLVYGGNGDLLWQYFYGHTPDKEMINFLLECVRKGYASAMTVMLNLVKQQKKPSSELIGKLLLCDQSQNFTEKLMLLVNTYSDQEAVNFSTRNIGGDISEEGKQAIVSERWTNYCKERKEICRAAQKNMNYWQYQIFSLTGHNLDYCAMQHLCLSIESYNQDYLRLIFKNEFKQIDEKMQAALRSEYWRYSLYLAVKQEMAKE